jgi:hypothetical protein
VIPLMIAAQTRALIGFIPMKFNDRPIKVAKAMIP